MLTLAPAFFLIALTYSTVGFGGGSSYIAFLAAAGVSYSAIPKIALLCNLVVVSGGCYHYFKNGFFSNKLLLPFAVSSVPMAYLGGLYPLEEKFYFLLLTVTLILCGLRILLIREKEPLEISSPSHTKSLFVGGVLGLASGMVGIGGGIFLSPLLINMGWARSKEAASLASLFIFLNSIAALLGQFSKDPSLPETSEYLPLLFAVFLGGQIGSRIGSHTRITHGLIQKGTGILTLLISAKLLFKSLN